MIDVSTSRYAARDLVVASGLAPIWITLGRPKFPLCYELAGEMPELAPSRRIFGMGWDEFAPAYLEQINRVDWQAVEEQLRAIAERVGAPGVALLCFENVLAGQHCHRRLLADHWQARTGRAMPELRPEVIQLEIVVSD